MNQPPGAVTTISLAELLDPPAGELRAATGVQSIDRIAGAGRYVRRAATVFSLDGTQPSELTYREHLTNTHEDFPSLHRFVLQDARVVGHGAVITRNNRLIEDSCWSMIAQGVVPAGLVRGPDGGLYPSNAPRTHIDRPALLVKHPFWRNYGHFLVDAAALLALLPGLAMPADLHLVIGRHEDAKMTAIVDEALGILAPGRPVLRHADYEAWSFDELHYASPVSRGAFFKLPQALAALRSVMLSSRVPGPRARRIYIPRVSGHNRRLANEAEVMALCSAAGFEVVQPETLSLRQQAQLFNGAEVIIGVKGAALTNLLFCNSAATVIALSPDCWVEPFFWDIAGQIGMRYIEVLGSPTEEVSHPASPSFVVHPGHVAQALAEAGITIATPAAAPAVPALPPAVSAPATPLPHHKGAFYQSVLARLHELLRPQAYLEIGVLDGGSLRLAQCPSIGVDPAMGDSLLAEATPGRHLFPMTSDQFFAQHDPVRILGRQLDLAFLDGMHMFEFLLRDFMHAERCSRPGSWIVLHDCMPLDRYMAGREQFDMDRRHHSVEPGWWAGDVWKTVAILRRFRPDLHLVALDSDPTGLILLTNLDPQSRVLANNYVTIMQEYLSLPDDDATFARFQGALPVTETAQLDAVIRSRAA